MIAKRITVALAALSLTLGSCVATKSGDDLSVLAKISIIDRNGMTETISNTDRLKQYENVDFLTPQPYTKVHRIFTRDKRGDIRGYISSYYPNGQIKQNLEVINNRAYGTYNEWHQNGHLKLEVTIIGGVADLNNSAENSWLFDGLSYAWDENGRLLAEIPYHKGELEGIALYYHPNGMVWKKIPYTKGEIHGTQEIYLENEKVLQTSQFIAGRKEGPSYRFWYNNEVAVEEQYHEGLLTEGEYRDAKGRIISQVIHGNGYRAIFGKLGVAELHQYINGEQQGEVKVFGKGQKIARMYHMRDGVKHGSEIEFDEEREFPRFSINWYDGVIQGVAKTWYSNGVLESQREMSHNKKNGLSTAWYKNGNVMLIEEYDNNKLLKGEYYKMGEPVAVSIVTNGNGLVTIFDPEGNYIQKVNYEHGSPAE